MESLDTANRCSSPCDYVRTQNDFKYCSPVKSGGIGLDSILQRPVIAWRRIFLNVSWVNVLELVQQSRKPSGSRQCKAS